MKARSLLHLTPFAVVGGCEVNCLEMIRGIAECDHTVLVFDAEGPMSPRWETAGATVEHLHHWQVKRSSFGSALRAWTSGRTKPDAIVYWSTSRLPVVIAALDPWDVPLTAYLGNPIRPGAWERLRLSVDEWTHSSRRKISLVACSQYVARSYRNAPYFRRFGTHVVYNAVDPALDKPHAYRQLPPGTAPRVGMVARLDPIKDHLTAIRALAAAAPHRPDILLEFAGDGPLLARLRDEAARLGIGERVRFLGSRSVGPLLAEWDIYLHSTTDSEGMGTAVAEAMAAGVPCLVSDLVVMREVCGSEGAAFAPAADPDRLGAELVRLVDDRDRRRTLGLAAQERARRLFGARGIAQDYEKLLFPGAAAAGIEGERRP